MVASEPVVKEDSSVGESRQPKNSDRESRFTPGVIPLLRYVRLIRWSGLKILGFVTIALVATWAATTLATPIYQATAIVQYNPRAAWDNRTVVMDPKSAGDIFMATQLQLIQSGAVLRMLAGLSDEGRKPTNAAVQPSPFAALPGSLQVTRTNGTNLLLITYACADRAASAEGANAIMRAYYLYSLWNQFEEQRDDRKAELSVRRRQLQADLTATEAEGWRRLLLQSEAELDRLDALTAEVRSQVSTPPTSTELFTRQVSTVKEASIELGFTQSRITIVEEARPSSGPVAPRLRQNLLLAFLCSFFLSIVVVFVADGLKTATSLGTSKV